jgi:grpE
MGKQQHKNDTKQDAKTEEKKTNETSQTVKEDMQKDAGNAEGMKKEHHKTSKHESEIAKGDDKVEKNGKENKKEEKCDFEKEAQKWKEEYLRKAADFENYRKRMIKEKKDAIDYANETLLVDLITVLDNFDRAIDAITTYADEKTRSYMEGFNMIQKQFYSMLESKYSLKYYKSEGERFDPNIHDAKATRESEDVKDEIVEKELLKGYKLHERIIRVAQVETIKPKK